MRLLDFVKIGAEQQNFSKHAESMAKEKLGYANFESLSDRKQEEAKEFMA